MRLWITEKPSAAQNLVAGLCAAFRTRVTNQATRGRDRFHALANGDIVVPLHGHLIEPVFLSPQHKQARIDTYFDFLPIRVRDFEYVPKPEMRDGKIRQRDGKPVPSEQYTVVTRLIGKATEIVNAGDIDREGQLIVDELLIHCGVDPTGKHKPIWRLPLVSAREEDIRDQVLALSERNGDAKWVRRRLTALARQHSDAAVGFNGSMAYQAATGYRRASVGRVQTPVLALIVDRDTEIANFKPRDYFVPIITLKDGTELTFHSREGAAGAPGFDEQGRIIEESVARQMCDLIARGMPGRIAAAEQVHGSEAPPLPFSATVLFSAVSKRTGMTPKEAEKAAQSLYERHKAISYVGTDCQYLSTSMLADVRGTMTALSRLYAQAAAGANLELRSKAWNDAKVDEHHAIVPTGRLPESATPEEKAVFDAVARRYMAQFYPAHEFVRHRLAAVFGRDEFRATRKETTRMGWKEIEGHLEQGGPTRGDGESDVEVADEAKPQEKDR